jgi:hypothetical protein
MFDGSPADVGKETVTVCLRTPGRGRAAAVSEFKTDNRVVAGDGDWLVEAGVSVAAMESTSGFGRRRFLLPGEVMDVFGWLQPRRT